MSSAKTVAKPVCNVWTIDGFIRVVDRALLSLGDTSRKVASRLGSMRCRGESGNPENCPVIEYLRRQQSGTFRLRMLSGGHLEILSPDGWVETIRVPYAVERFNHRFDNGEFQELSTRLPENRPVLESRIDWNAMHEREKALAA